MSNAASIKKQAVHDLEQIMRTLRTKLTSAKSLQAADHIQIAIYRLQRKAACS